MRTRLQFSAPWLLAVILVCTLGAAQLPAQVSAAPPRMTQAVVDTNRVALRGNVHPLARPEFDRGLAPASLPMEHMMLLLKRSPRQEAALDALLAEQQDRNSPNYHRWLTPSQFGAQFGPSDQDIQAIESWLESQGFAVESVSKGRTIIEFSGSAGEVQNAFHAAIHRYVLPNGKQHWANSANPEIPAALAPVVSGIRGLNAFFPTPLSHIVHVDRASQPKSAMKPAPLFTFAASGPCSAVQAFGLAPNGNICFMITPSDFATIYNIAPLWNGTPAIDGSGETIAIANDSNINLSDISNFRSLMGLPAKNPQVILATGVDPGVQANGDESEAVLDVEWSGAVAKNATIDLVIAPSTNVSFGGDLAAEFIVDNNVAPILSYSFGACESALGTSGNSFYNSLWQQAAAEGITVLVASGDNGSAACDINVVNGPASQPAQNGLQVNGLASTPYNIAVGGTDFDDVSNPSQYWSTANSPSPTQASALGYIPETTWNETCTNAVFTTSPLSAQFGTSSEGACNNSTLINNGFVVPLGGSGGLSSIYPKPAWQSAITPNDSARDLPDVSLFAGTGAVSASFYYLCESDLAVCSFTQNTQIYGVGGTSVSAQVFAGIVALIDQKAGERQGNINPVLYSLAPQGTNTCASAANPSSTCMFYDVANGTNATPCLTGSTDCTTSTSGDANGILEKNNQFAYNAGTGYDLATGLGTVNAQNLVNVANTWVPPSTAPDFSITSSSPNPSVNLSTSGSGTLSINIVPQNGFTGSVYLTCPGLPVGDTCSFSPASPATINGATAITVTVSGTIASVPGRTDRPAGPASWSTGGEITFAFACLAALLLFGLRLRQRRWNTALALVAFALFVIAGCGGGSSPSNNGGGGGGGGATGSPFTTVVTATTCTNGAGCSSGTTHSLAFTIN